jgi:hypothetical protein
MIHTLQPMRVNMGLIKRGSDKIRDLTTSILPFTISEKMIAYRMFFIDSSFPRLLISLPMPSIS